MSEQQTAGAQALEVLQGSIGTHGGFMAISKTTFGGRVPEARAPNYYNVWARDGVICGLAGVASGDAHCLDALGVTLIMLGRNAGPVGQIPSNVTPYATGNDGVSYGGNAGRVDATLWWLVGLGVYGHAMHDDAFVRGWWGGVTKAVELLRAWEFNAGGLLYVPQAGDWADEYVLSGYVLYDQALRLLALRWVAYWSERLFGNDHLLRTVVHTKSGKVVEEQDTDRVQRAIERSFAPIGGPSAYRLAAFRPGGQSTQFDALGNAIACLAGGGLMTALDYGQAHLRRRLVPAFHPIITPRDSEFADLVAAASGDLRNMPGRYHNGGLWPMVNGFWALALRWVGREDEANDIAAAIADANRLDGCAFAEFLDANTGKPGGTWPQAWSAAGQLLATADPRFLLPPK
ncbi:hypothetical protein HYV74_05200 [Candidatus Uhrbacteria bacterium]|nr:hypothetical protein [Candidatus Uhrbacteria bacterium]